ncbi:hypothetical protein GF382_01375 [Candidatus Falkowbacteria bacterium]|nr:hypothetical protein [Candidatus Falkowbacteria bacterium]
MLRINLVPETTKKEISLRRTYGLIKGTGYIFVFLAVVISAVFIFSRTFLLENTDPDTTEKTMVSLNNKEVSKKPRLINQKVKSVLSVQEKNYSHFDIIKNISEKVPPGITFSRLKINTDEAKLEIKGKADLRENLLSLKANLENDPFYANIDFPLQNILSKTDINFGITAKLDLKQLEGEEK